jgi:hypothetical protein
MIALYIFVCGAVVYGRKKKFHLVPLFTPWRFLIGSRLRSGRD